MNERGLENILFIAMTVLMVTHMFNAHFALFFSPTMQNQINYKSCNHTNHYLHSQYLENQYRRYFL